MNENNEYITKTNALADGYALRDDDGGNRRIDGKSIGTVVQYGPFIRIQHLSITF